MRILHAAAIAGVLALSGCVDVDMTATIQGADRAEVDGYMTIARQMLEMSGGGDGFCPADEGGTLTLGDTEARCDVHIEGSFAEVFKDDPNGPSPTVEDLGDGTVRVSFPIGDVGAQSAEMRNDPNMVAMMRPMLEGHSFTVRVAGAEVVSTNGTMAEDGRSASFSFNLVDMLDPNLHLPETFETVVRY